MGWEARSFENQKWTYDYLLPTLAQNGANFFPGTRNKLRYVVARWGYSTNIAAWEFFNEIDNAVFTQQDSLLIPHDAVTLWHGEMSRYLKDIGPYQHLVTTSVPHRDILGMNSIEIPSIYPDYIQTFGKPYVVGEFGYRWEDADPTYKEGFNYDYRRKMGVRLVQPYPYLAHDVVVGAI